MQSARQADISKRVMEADPILKENEISVDYKTDNTMLTVDFAASSDRILRTVVNSTIESLKSVIECFDEFDE